MTSKNQNLPPELRIAQDHYRPGKHGPKKTLSAGHLSEPPRAPSGFSRRGRAEWKQVCQLLIDAGVLTERDLFGVESYIKLREELWELERLVETVERYHEDEKGNIRAHPIMGEMRSVRSAIFQYEKALGLNPCARARANAVAKDASVTGGAATGKKLA